MKVLIYAVVNYIEEKGVLRQPEFLRRKYLENIRMNEKIYEIMFLGKFVALPFPHTRGNFERQYKKSYRLDLLIKTTIEVRVKFYSYKNQSFMY